MIATIGLMIASYIIFRAFELYSRDTLRSGVASTIAGAMCGITVMVALLRSGITAFGRRFPSQIICWEAATNSPKGFFYRLI